MQSWGLDHVRLPMDYMLFESDDAPGVYDEARLDYVDRTLRWCKQYGLNLILDLHHAPGFFFGNGDQPPQPGALYRDLEDVCTPLSGGRQQPDL